jgi:cellulose biosynthesis protein BcsQ
MKTITVYLMTKDLEFGKALANSLQFHSSHFTITLQSNEPVQKETSIVFDQFDICLTDDRNINLSNAVYLAEDPENELIDIEKKCFIAYKYHHVAHISTLLRLAYSIFANTEMISDDTANTKLVSVCASAGGVGCTSVALGICQELSRFYGEKVLYVSLEEFESTSIYFRCSSIEPNNITRYLYGILIDDHQPRPASEGFMIKDIYGISAFHPARGRNPLRELSANEFIEFMNAITKANSFTYIILDCSNGLDAAIESAMNLSTVIYLIMGNTENSKRQNAYLQSITYRTNESTVECMKHIRNFYEEPELAEMEENMTKVSNAFNLEQDFGSLTCSDGHFEISLDKAFGQGIHQIVQDLTVHTG